MSFDPSHPAHLNVPANADFDLLRDVNWNPLTVEPPASTLLSGGEIPEDAKAIRLEMITRISAQSDVRQVLEIALRDDGRFLYLIETPFINSFPRYVIGECDRMLETAKPLFRCGALWSAQAEWDRRRHQENHHNAV